MNAVVEGFFGISALVAFLVFWPWLGRSIARARGQSPASGALIGIVCALGILVASGTLQLPLTGFLRMAFLMSLCVAAAFMMLGLLPANRGTLSLRRLRESGEVNETILEFDGSDIADVELAQLAGNQSIEELRLGGTPITDQGVAYLENLVQLRALDLSRTQVTDASLASISRLANLRRLWLGGTAVTDKGLRQLTSLDQLEEIYLANSKVTQAGVQDLSSKLSSVKIDI